MQNSGLVFLAGDDALMLVPGFLVSPHVPFGKPEAVPIGIGGEHITNLFRLHQHLERRQRKKDVGQYLGDSASEAPSEELSEDDSSLASELRRALERPDYVEGADQFTVQRGFGGNGVLLVGDMAVLCGMKTNHVPFAPPSVPGLLKREGLLEM